MTNSSPTTIIEHFDSLQLDVTPARQKLTSNIHSSHDLKLESSFGHHLHPDHGS
jgi:hypothetical protein